MFSQYYSIFVSKSRIIFLNTAHFVHLFTGTPQSCVALKPEHSSFYGRQLFIY